LAFSFLSGLLSNYYQTLSEILCGDATLYRFHLLSRIFASSFSFGWALLQFACQQRTTAEK
jgi:hypothetical protein